MAAGGRFSAENRRDGGGFCGLAWWASDRAGSVPTPDLSCSFDKSTGILQGSLVVRMCTLPGYCHFTGTGQMYFNNPENSTVHRRVLHRPEDTSASRPGSNQPWPIFYLCYPNQIGAFADRNFTPIQ